VKNAKSFSTVTAVSFLTLGFLLSASLSLGISSARAQESSADFLDVRSTSEPECRREINLLDEKASTATNQPTDSASRLLSPRDRDRDETAAENDRTYDEIWSLIESNFLYRDRLKNWDSWRHKFDHKMKSRAEAQKAITEMIESLGDEYTFFRDETTTEENKNLRHKTKVVDYKMLEGQIGYMHISTLNSMFCVPETRNALIELSQAHGLIVDLRDNWGGSINTTFDVFSLLTGTGKFVSMKGTTDSAEYTEELSLSETSAVTTTDGVETSNIREFNLAAGKPLVVLVNESTKSAAEMLAGALRDNGRALVLGSRTFGKGIVQRVWEFPNNTSIKISSARYFLPNGGDVHRVGLTPDLLITNEVVFKRRGSDSSQSQLAGIESELNLLRKKPYVGQTYSMVMQVQLDKIAHQQTPSGADQTDDLSKDRQLSEAQTVLRRKLVSLAKP
jgi:C-terminal processing protease CtpA/Prc